MESFGDGFAERCILCDDLGFQWLRCLHIFWRQIVDHVEYTCFVWDGLVLLVDLLLLNGNGVWCQPKGLCEVIREVYMGLGIN